MLYTCSMASTADTEEATFHYELWRMVGEVSNDNWIELLNMLKEGYGCFALRDVHYVPADELKKYMKHVNAHRLITTATGNVYYKLLQ